MLYLLVMLEQSLLLEVALHAWLVHELLLGVQAIVEGLEKQTVLESEQVFASKYYSTFCKANKLK